MKLTEKQIERYSRQIVLKEVGGKGQEKLLNAKITLIGLGALGSPTAYYLAAAGIWKLTIIDSDVVELSNLHRQILHHTKDIGIEKTKSAYEKLKALNPECEIEIINKRVIPENVLDCLKGADFVIEGSDNLMTKMLINDACIKLGIPFTIAGVLRFHGQIMTVIPKEKTTCYRCIFGGISNEPAGMSCSQAGVIGMIPGVLGCMESIEAIKYILGVGELIINKILYIDLLKYSFKFIEVYRDDKCIACGNEAQDLIKNFNYGSDLACH
ncbi:MAG: HesA/MoeB/ThiF family protein [Promethearchaeia archaeon]